MRIFGWQFKVGRGKEEKSQGLQVRDERETKARQACMHAGRQAGRQETRTMEH